MRQVAAAFLAAVPFAASVGLSGCHPDPDEPGGGGDAGSCRATIGQGALQGIVAGGSCEYLGVPYAMPPTGALRFAPPEPAAAWSGTRDATRMGARCMQSSPPPPGVLQSEDCLSVNVYAPSAPPRHALPVMVFLHGAGLTSGVHGARELSGRGAVVVTVNYRAGVLGHLALPELDELRQGQPSGSDGIRDQQLALAWVRDNASQFHGDGSNVTVFGESAGALGACIHLVSPGSRGLAHRYILQSGHCLDEATFSRQRAHAVGAALVQAFCAGAGNAMDCLRSVDAATLMAWLGPIHLLNALGAAFGPVIEGAGGVLPDAPFHLVQSGEYDRSAAVMSGTTKEEWERFAQFTPAPSVAALHESMARVFPDPDLLDAAKEAYPAASDAEAQSTINALMADTVFRCKERRLLRALKAQGTEKVFLYSYEVGRAWHADELLGLFEMAPELDAAFFAGSTTPSSGFRERMQSYWIRFAEGGDPNGGGAPAWPAYSEESPYLALRDPVPAPAMGHRTAQCDFWDSIWAVLPPGPLP